MNGLSAQMCSHTHTHSGARDSNTQTGSGDSSKNGFRNKKKTILNANFNHFLRLTRPNRLLRPLQCAFVRDFFDFIFNFSRIGYDTHAKPIASESKENQFPYVVVRCAFESRLWMEQGAGEAWGLTNSSS